MTDYGMSILAIFKSIFFLIFFVISLKYEKLLDRYRLKYGFDKDLELKELDNNLNRLERREKAYKKRVFKD